MGIRLKIPVILSAAMLALSAHAGGAAESLPFMPVGSPADAPFGFTEMCARDQILCQIGTVSTRAIAHADAGSAALLKAINQQVNRSVVQVRDSDAMGVGEYWNRLSSDPRPVGDCEDIAIEKRIRLEQAGFPADRMFYAVAFVPRYGLHTVLVARLDDGDYVLDSMDPYIQRWDKVKYVWLRRQLPGQPLVWSRVGGENAVPEKSANVAGVAGGMGLSS